MEKLRAISSALDYMVVSNQNSGGLSLCGRAGETTSATFRYGEKCRVNDQTYVDVRWQDKLSDNRAVRRAVSVALAGKG